MTEKSRSSSAGTVVAIALGAGLAWAGSQGGGRIAGLPAFALAVALAFAIQWVVFVPSYLRQTEHFFDLTGASTYISVTALTVAGVGATDARSVVLLALVVVWAGRLGTFLFRRVRRAGKDDRFDRIKTSFAAFLTTWTLQGLWVSMTLAAALAAITSAEKAPLDAYVWVGLGVWLVGFSFEAVADFQKNRFRADPVNAGQFIRTGLWAWSRHPNYFGEIVLWTGVAIIAFPVLSGWQYATLISPVFVFLLLTRISGIPLLERKADERWGGQDAYEAYKRQTPVLVPFIGRRSR